MRVAWSIALRLRCSRARASYYVAAAAQRSGHWVLGRDGRPGRPTQNTKLARACTVGSSVAMIFRKVLGGNNIWRPIEEPTTSDSIAGVGDEPSEVTRRPPPHTHTRGLRQVRAACPLPLPLPLLAAVRVRVLGSPKSPRARRGEETPVRVLWFLCVMTFVDEGLITGRQADSIRARYSYRMAGGRETKTSPLPVLTYRNRRWACPANRGPPYRIRICNLDYYYY
jgi:hypothetical protein